jgi:RNA polymerase sigma factor (sigma-70 family)
MAALMMSGIISAENVSGTTGERSEQQLITAAKCGDKPAFGELCERHTKQIFRVAVRITRNREDAEDAMQDSFLNAYVHLKNFDGRSKFVTWLTRIAINSALMKLRKKRATPEISMDQNDAMPESRSHFEFPDKALNPEQAFYQSESRKLLDAAIARLRPRTRKVVELQVLQEMSMKEAARTLEISETAAKSRMFHARESLRASLSARGSSLFLQASARRHASVAPTRF